MHLKHPRVPPLPESDWSSDVRALLPRSSGASSDEPLNIFTTLARHPKLLKRWLVFGNHVLFKSTLPARERELVILRTGWLCRSEYEFGQHTRIGKACGLTDEEIRRILAGPDGPGWGELDQLLLKATDELHEAHMIADATWDALSRHYDVQQLMDLVFAVGQYTLVSMALNTLGVQLEQGAEGFPA